MATGIDNSMQSVENLDDLLKCNICSETLKEPKILPCLHTFCKSCIRTHFDSFKGKGDGFLCPVCRQSVFSRFPDDISDYVENLSTNQFIVSLLNKSSIAKAEQLCDSCKFHGNDNKAVSWCVICEEGFCEQCAQYHKGFKVSADHEMIPITDNDNYHERVNISKITFCDDHQKNVVQVFCVDHKKACCTLCATLSHRKCEKVISIDEAASGIKQNQKVSELLQQMEDNIKLLADVFNIRQENETNIDIEATAIETTVMKIIKDKKDHLDKLQHKVLSELEAAKKQASTKVADDLNDFSSYKSALTNWKTILTRVVQHGSEQQCLNILNEISPKMKKMQREVGDALKMVRIISLRFEELKNVNDFELTHQSIGALTVKESKIKIEKLDLKSFDYYFRNGNIKVIRTINVAPSGGSTGIFLDAMILFAAYNTKKVVKYSQNGKLLGALTIPSQPTDICSITETQVVVASFTKQLYIIDCRDMTLQKTIKLKDVSVFGLCVYDNNQFIVGSNDKLSWIDQISGTKAKTMTSGESFFVSTTGNNDFIHGDGDNSVSYVVNGTKKFTYTNDELENPRGIGIDDQRNFYITGCGSKNIHQITDKGELIKIVPASTVGIQAPRIFRFESGTNRFLVTCGSSGKATLCEIE